MKGKYLCACPVCFYDTNGSRIDVRLLEQSPEQVDLRLTMRMCNRMGIATLIYHYVPDNTVYVIVFCDRIRQSFEYKEDTPFSPTISVSQAKYRSQNIATSIAEVTRTADRTAAAASPSSAIPNLREAVCDKAERLDCRSISRACCAEAHKRKGEPKPAPITSKALGDNFLRECSPLKLKVGRPPAQPHPPQGRKSPSVSTLVPVSWISTSGAASASVLARTMVIPPLTK